MSALRAELPVAQAPQGGAAPESAPPAIEAVGLGFDYPQGPRLHFADIRLPQGAHLLLRGPSGSGKSTWLALVGGLCGPTRGRLHVAGRALQGRVPDSWRAQTVAVLPQRLHLSDALDVRGNLGLVDRAAGRGVDHAAIDRVLDRLALADLGGRYPSQLSGGQAQRVALGRALLARPRLILADEPTASLDDELAAEALQLLRDTAQELGASVVIATHDPRVAPAWPDAQTLQLQGLCA